MDAPRPLFSVGNTGPTPTLPPYRPGNVYTVHFGPCDAARGYYEAFQAGLPKWVLATNFCYDLAQPPATGYSVACQCSATSATNTADKRGRRFYEAMQQLYNSLPPVEPPPAAPKRSEAIAPPAPRPFGQAVVKVPVGFGTGQLFS